MLGEDKMIEETKETARIEYDDGFLEIKDKINKLLKDKNLELTLDEKVYDGFVIVILKQVV